MIGIDKIDFLQKLFGDNKRLKEMGFIERIFSAPDWDKTNWVQSLYYNYITKSGRLLEAYEKGKITNNR